VHVHPVLTQQYVVRLFFLGRSFVTRKSLERLNLATLIMQYVRRTLQIQRAVLPAVKTCVVPVYNAVRIAQIEYFGYSLRLSVMLARLEDTIP